MELAIYIGNFGSGKTEISLNHALRHARQGKETTLVDLDIVKPYFRSREARAMLQREGVRLITPGDGLADADLPVITPEVLGALTSARGTVIIDVGGDNLGATALGRFKPYIDRMNGYLRLVVNPYRPFTRDAAGVAKIRREIENASRLQVKKVISNPNLGQATTLDTVLEGHQQVVAVARELGLPLEFLAVYSPLLNEVKRIITDVELFSVENFMLPPWYLEEGGVHRIDPNLRLPGHEKFLP